MARYLGSVNLLGLNQFGQNPGMNPLFGMLIGGGVSATTSIVLEQTGATRHPEAFGLLAGLMVSGGMYAMKSTRHAGVAGAISAVFASGVAWLRKALAVKAAGAGVGLPRVRTLNGLGIPMARTLNGLGIPTMSQVTQPIGVAGSQLAAPGMSAPPVSLLGPTSPQAAHLSNIGGPTVHGLSSAYGATLMGGGR